MAIAVVRAETFYVPPPTQPRDLWAGTPAAELVWKWYETRMGRRVFPPEGTVDTSYFARINQNRWIADCVCGSAQVVSPTDQRYACVECGWGWCTLLFPSDPDAVEASLAALPPYLRNWWNDLDPKNPNAPVVGDPGAGAP
ncbi:hypothetical protein [Streptomyces sp. NRRL S-813]|uniref:hypothetical protein n=1 Tax=Streptomyces sp. NRRL S-813 TaxID=1463919 RepID=UPI0004BFADF0|nr:hypothetical protein [Streptomyces sp. NRRL S-813]